ncbi:3D-(3,5/4)-trihydroxycyclohexane-1,2-dione hydrolase [Microlunatus phosphovorus NM-1]|uniref:3D-(3,5/4)-trihydroxycyclohexane-1,2-dione hydrolase n=1 Tax=Microlunatus phosphovorus (strain ATCC 700054 / DSM 10555 / JCM 9379 / NBRC 101784 / NCIMB 13414 / VKM Ac-1990 / NM-1) TaxID=1032480 RepID=F5XFH8_MICPN|nr:3D-(3,5/4)-trihydroxycyclohexane-1,2-dione acylhydrolase (decyclizing) [Microlunatus phosphovorus]BAK35385.1 3D-(3,5/4)-trihydroxycyclohexane-1,2-dione hydrolase [Microlunatus phosphovorus NM-1]
MSNTSTTRLTVGQAVVRFLAAQRVERDGLEQQFFGGALGIFGHGNVAGIGQALLQYRKEFRLYQGRNEQGMVHIATGYAKMKNRLGAMAVTTSIGPGATNMVTGAATATVNRLPVLCLPSDIFASRRTGPVLQQLESNFSWDYSASDAFKAVSKYWDRINRPDQLPTALLEAMRTLTSPADTGAVTLSLPQDVQAEAWDFPARLFRPRTWLVPRARADREALRRAAQLIAGAQRPVIIAGGGVIYSDATAALAEFAASTGIPVGVTQAGKASLPFDHPQMVNALGASGSVFANKLANEADLIIGIGTRYTDFTTASNTLFRNPDVQFVNLNVAELDAYKESALGLVGDARESITELAELLGDHSVGAEYRAEVAQAAADWRTEVDRIIEIQDSPTLAQAEAIGIVNATAGDHHVVVNAAGSMPGDLHRLWRPSDPKAYDLEYGNSCMGYEVGGAVGAKLADPSRDVFCFIGDGTFLLSSQEIMTAVQEGLKITVLLVDNSGYGSIAALSETRGSQAFACRFSHRDSEGQFDDDNLVGVDLAANAASYGADVLTASTAAELQQALAEAAGIDNTVVIYVKVDAKGRFGGSGAWWDVPVPETSELDSTQTARAEYDAEVANQQLYL